uniref:SAM domain-containing protein n=1 Tax=Nelumbo nucifera TaxID=4432 RepID=A0A822ZZK5_NELNU|nr:TPA_asm: hypothetical protein HUJ06_018476 [Nelumbo nucifera]
MLKLQKKGPQKVYQNGKGTIAGVQDLRNYLGQISSSAAWKKKTQSKDGKSVDGFIQSLSLEKYLIIFQAEEIDMTALVNMTDDISKLYGFPWVAGRKYCWPWIPESEIGNQLTS